MRIDEASDAELMELRNGYTRELRTEQMASMSVKRQWKIVVAALDEVLKQRNGGARTVLDARQMTRPGDEPLA